MPSASSQGIAHGPSGGMLGSGLRRWLAPLLAVLGLSAALGAASATAGEDDNYKVVEGLGIYLGVVPAAIVRGHAPEHPGETAMHGGVPTGPHDFHVIVAIFDEAGNRVENAEVTAMVSGLGHVGATTVALEPMTVANTVTYGNFVTLPAGNRYDIVLTIRIPGRSVAKATFTYEHDQ